METAWLIPDNHAAVCHPSMLPWIFIHGNRCGRLRKCIHSDVPSMLPWIFIHGNSQPSRHPKHRLQPSMLPWIFIHGNCPEKQTIPRRGQNPSMLPWIFIHGNPLLSHSVSWSWKPGYFLNDFFNCRNQSSRASHSLTYMLAAVPYSVMAKL